MPTTGERIKKLREGRRLSRAAMSNALGIKETRIQDIERGKQKLPSDLLTKVADYFGVTVEYVLTGAIGARETSTNYVAEKGACALSREEEVLVEKYRQLKPGDRTRAQAFVDALATTQVKKKETG
jgi:transcriptional regulator with XRE-family HTH domain